jgi:hypothetical protein
MKTSLGISTFKGGGMVRPMKTMCPCLFNLPVSKIQNNI